jgi:putative nucleotidyltransferase with HDIG domain
MEAHAMLPNIREHSFRVMQVADRLGQALAAAGFELHLPLISTGALLHDIGKTACLGTTDNHAQLGADILASLGFPELAQVVMEHVRLNDEAADSRPLREAEVVNYADKRVLHAQVVTLAERFADLQVRYGRTPSARVRIAAMEIKTQTLEGRLFAPLNLGPLDLFHENSYQQSAFSGQPEPAKGEGR